MPRIYLDNAATSWPKPPAVYEAVDRFQREIGALAGRGTYDSAGDAARLVRQARALVAGVISAPDPTRVLFTPGCTHALNQAIFGMVRPGDHVVTTVCEHNAILRPLAMLRDSQGVEVSYAQCDSVGVVDPAEIAAAIRPTTWLVAITAASNVTGAVMDLRAIGAVCRDAGVRLLVDAAQLLGHETLDVVADNISLLAAPGHKGLRGPLGVGMLWMAPGTEAQLRPQIFGGTGAHSELETPAAKVPESYEAGSLNVPAIAGLSAGIETLAEEGKIAQRMTKRLMRGLAEIAGVTLYGPPPHERRAAVVSFNIKRQDPQQVAAILASAGVECRAGLHCAPRMHKALGTLERGGTVRLSPGVATSEQQIEQVITLVQQIAEMH